MLDRRARALARPVSDRSRAERVPVATFTIGHRLHALEMKYLCAVVDLDEVSSLPRAPSHIMGVTVARDTLLLVADLRPLLRLPQPSLTGAARLITCGVSSAELALVVEEMNEMIELDAEEIETPAWLQTGTSGTLIRGVTSQPLILLDGTKLFTDSRLFLREENTGKLQEI